MSKLSEATCDNCGKKFKATFEQLDRTGFFTMIKSDRGVGETLRIYNFCSYDCEKDFVKKLEKKHKDFKGSWKEASAEDKKNFPDYYQERKCALCQSTAKLQQSHIIPRFVAKWLIDTSGTGFARPAENPEYRVQDTTKLKLLCSNCETLLSSWERYFAENIFFPYQEGTTEFQYDGRLLKFLVSMFWRLAKTKSGSLESNPNQEKHVEAALKIWENYLLDKRKDPGPYENHMFFFASLEKSEDLPPDFLWYSLRSIDSGLKEIKNNRIFIYVKLPGILIASSIFPTKFKDWKNTLVEEKGLIESDQEITDADFLNFLVDRSKLREKTSISDSDSRKIANSIRSKKDRFLNSKTLETILKIGKMKRKKLMPKLNPAVKQILEILDNSQIDQNLSETDRKSILLALNLIGNSLAELSEEKAKKLEKDTCSAIATSKKLKSSTSSVSDLGDLIVILRTLLNSTRDQRKSEIEKDFSNIEREDLYPKARVILILTWNPLDENPSFDFSYNIYSQKQSTIG